MQLFNKTATNFQVPDGRECQCGDVTHRKAKQLGAAASARFEQVLRCLMHKVCKIGHVAHNAQISQMPAKEQPESKSDSPTADDVNVDTQGAKKSVRFSSLHAVARSGQPTNPLDPSVARSEQSRATRDFWISSGNQSLIRVHLEPRSELFVPE